MNKHPYIGRSVYGVDFLLYSETSTYALSGFGKGDYVNLDERKEYFTNITAEYLANTYGKVESPEHAEFIIELCEVNGVEFNEYPSHSDEYFFVAMDGLYFSYTIPGLSSSLKRIAIPMPPKSDFKHKPIDNLNLPCKPAPIAKNNWPQVGFNVVLVCGGNTISGELLALTKKYAVISQGKSDEQHLHLSSWSFVKPKTEDEILRDDLIELTCSSAINMNEKINAFMEKYNITKKGE